LGGVPPSKQDRQGDAGLEPTAFGSVDSPEESGNIKEQAKKEGNSTP